MACSEKPLLRVVNMEKTKAIDPVQTKKEQTDIEYLEYSINYLQEYLRKNREAVKQEKEKINALQEDMKVIKSIELKKACQQIHNSMVMRKNQILAQLKEGTQDVKHVISIYKTLKRLERTK